MHRKTEQLISALLGLNNVSETPGELIEKVPYYREVLAAEFLRRCQKNPRYSLRAFAKALDVQVPHLSRILRGQRRLSHPRALELASKLGLGEEATTQFWQSIYSSAHTSGNRTS